MERISTLTKRGRFYIHEVKTADTTVWQIVRESDGRAIQHFRSLNGQTRRDAEDYLRKEAQHGS